MDGARLNLVEVKRILAHELSDESRIATHLVQDDAAHDARHARRNRNFPVSRLSRCWREFLQLGQCAFMTNKIPEHRMFGLFEVEPVVKEINQLNDSFFGGGSKARPGFVRGVSAEDFDLLTVETKKTKR